MRPRRGAWVLLVAGAAAASAASQEAETPEKLEMRVTSIRPGAVVVDRGAEDGLEVGDVVTFFPREGGLRPGTVVEVEARRAVVEFLDPGISPPPGTRGEASIPAERLAPRKEPPRPPERAAPEHPPWENRDEEWSRDLPLLSRVEAVRPEERARKVSGRFYAIGDQTWTSEAGRFDGFYRFGGGARVENPFGRGGRLLVDGEGNFRDVHVPDDQDDRETTLRLDRLSYAWGGTRFARSRWEVGRFLQDGMPEFGVLDGVEWDRRLSSGHRLGFSAGFMPEPDAEYDSFEDFQIAGYFRWVADESERFSLAGGFQKSFHDGDADRDLVVMKAEFLPREGWTLQGTAWVDLYTAGDDEKGPGVDLTQAYVVASRRWETGNGLQATYSHLAFPEMERREFRPVLAAQLADDHYDRLGLQGWVWPSARVRVRGSLGGWIDEDEAGGDAEVGVELKDLFGGRSRTTVALFGNQGRFGPTVGGRAGYGEEVETGRWDLLYEFAAYVHEEFTVQDDEILQHRLRASRDFDFGDGWDLAAYVQGFLWEDEGAVSVGFSVQKTF